MKMEKKITGLVLTVLMLCAAIGSYAQGRGRGHDKHASGHSSYAHSHHKKNVRKHPVHYNHHQDRRVRVVHYHHAAPWVTPRRASVRYVYFKEYDVYYDYTRNVYLSLSGRNWVVSAAIPVSMRHVDVRRVAYAEVDYCGDDLYYYHTHHHRPRHVVCCSR